MCEMAYCGGKADYNGVRLFQNSDTTLCRRTETAGVLHCTSIFPPSEEAKITAVKIPFQRQGMTRC